MPLVTLGGERRRPQSHQYIAAALTALHRRARRHTRVTSSTRSASNGGDMPPVEGEDYMTIKGLAFYLFSTCALFACSLSRPPLTAEQEAALTAPATPAIEEPTPAMLQAALSGDPETMREAITNVGSCHTATTCPGFGSCSGWSAFSFCGDTCTKRCCHDSRCFEPDIGGNVFNEQYRVCFDAAGASCTEWNITSHFVCGC
jgi:hypothetical protein